MPTPLRSVSLVLAATLSLLSAASARQGAAADAVGGVGGAGALMVLNKSEATASVLDPATGAIRATIPVGDGPHEAATSPDGALVVVTNYGRQTPGSTLSLITLKDPAASRAINLAPYHRPHGVAFLPDSRRVLVTAEVEKKLLLVNLADGTVEAAIDTNQETSHMVALSADASRAFVANIRGGSVSVIDLPSRSLLKVIPTGAGAEGIAVHPTRPEVWITNRADDSISILNTATLEIEATLPCAKFPIRVAFTPAGDRALVSCAATGEVAILAVEDRREIARVKMEAAATADDDQGRLFGKTFGDSPVPVGVLVEPSGRYAFVANTNADLVMVIDLAQTKIVRRLRAGREPDGMTWTPAF